MADVEIERDFVREFSSVADVVHDADNDSVMLLVCVADTVDERVCDRDAE